MKITKLGWALVLVVFLPAVAHAAATGNRVPEYSAAQIFAANSTVNLIPTTNGSGNLTGIKCIFPSNASGASVRIRTSVNGATATNFIIDPTNLEQEQSGGGQFTSGWIPFNIEFTTSIQVQISNTSLGTATINCWAAWGLD